MDPFQKPRPFLRLLIGRPPLILRAPAFLLAAVGLYAFADPALRPRPVPRSAMTLRLVAATPGAWAPSPLAGATGFLEAEIEISGEAGPGWSSVTYAPNARIADPTVPTPPPKKPDPAAPAPAPAPNPAAPIEKPAGKPQGAPSDPAPAAAPTTTFAEIYTLWRARLEAGDTASAKTVGAPLTAAQQRDALERLAAREKQRGSDPNWRGFEPLTVDAGEDAKLLATLGRFGPLLVAGIGVGLAVARLLYRRQRRQLEAAAAAGRCPACQASRYGQPDDDPCPDCGRTLASALFDPLA